MLIVKALFWFALALLFAAVEIESEGKYGWAEKAPTWYRTTGFFGRLWGFFMGKKPLTGYHLILFFLTLVMFHIGFIMGVEWSTETELTTLAIYFAWGPTWDFLWFVLNPNYGVKNFKQGKVWWHAKSYWVLGLFPTDYLFGWGWSLILSIGAACCAKNAQVLVRHLSLLGLFLAFTFIAIVAIAPVYQRWHKAMRRHDDRDQARIFH